MESFSKVDIDPGEEKKQVLFGGQRVASFIRQVIAGRPVDGRRYHFDDDLVMAIHDRVSMVPGLHGFLRQTDSTTVGGEPVGPYSQLELKMHLFGRWLEEQMDLLKNNPEDIVLALYIAAAAHYGLTQPSLHPFDNGNGRTARALMNIVLMSQSYELTALGEAIPPIPIVRTDKDQGHYIRSLRAVGQTRTMNPFMAFIAQRWIDNLDGRFVKLREEIKHPKTVADKKLFDKLERRKELLGEFIKSGNKDSNGYRIYPIPGYFEPRYIHP